MGIIRGAEGMNGSNPPNLLKQAGAFLLVTLLLSLLVGFGFVVSGPEKFSAFDTAKIWVGMAALAAPFVVAGTALIGIPALLLARKTGLASSLLYLCGVGAAAGALAAPAAMSMVFPNSGDGLALLAAIGAGCGLVGALLWWHLIEKRKQTDSKNV